MTALQDALQRLARDLDALGAQWAVIGDLAVSFRTEPRFTRDVDVVVAVADDRAAEKLLADLQARGYRVLMILERTEADRLATVRLQPPSGTKVIVDLLFASSGIEPELVSAAERAEIFEGLIVPVAQTGALIALELLSETDTRLQDRQDLQALLAEATPQDLDQARQAIRLIVRRGFARGRDLEGALKRWLGET